MAIKTLKPSFRISRKDEAGNWGAIAFYSYLQPDFPLSDFTFARTQIGGCGAAVLTTLSMLPVEYGDMVELWVLDGASPVYSGFVEDVPKEGSATTYDYELLGWSAQLTWTYCRGLELTEITVQAAIQKVLDEYVTNRTDIVDKDASGNSLIKIDPFTDWDGMIMNLSFDRQTPAEVFEVIGQMVGSDYEWGVNEARVFYFRKKSTEIEYRWFEGLAEVESFSPDEDSGRLRNWLWLSCGRLSDGSDFLLEIHDQDSIDARGRREEWYSMPSSMPFYSEEDICRYGEGAVASVSDDISATATGLTNLFDNDITTYFESGKKQIPGVSLTSTLNDAASITTVASGADGTVIGSPSFAAGKFGNGIVTTAGNYCKFPTVANNITPEMGSISFWYKWGADASSIVAGKNLTFFDFIKKAYGGFRMVFTGSDTPNQQRFVFQSTMIGVNEIQNKVYSPLLSSLKTAIGSSYFEAGGIIYCSMAWDKNRTGAIKNPSTGKALSFLFMINGTAISWSSGKWAQTQCLSQLYLGVDSDGANPAGIDGGVIDNIKTWEIPLDLIDAWATEFSPEAIQWLQIDFPLKGKGRRWDVAKIRINSAGIDESSRYARGIKIELLPMLGSDWVEVYSSTTTPPADAEILIQPTKAVAMKVSLTRFATEYWRIYDLEVYEFNYADVYRYGQQQLDGMKDPTEAASLVLSGIQSIPVPRGKCSVRTKTGTDYEYEVKSVKFKADGMRATLELGEIPLTLDVQMRELQREILLNQYSSNSIAGDLASGEGLSNDAVTERTIGYILGSQILGTIEAAQVAGTCLTLDQTVPQDITGGQPDFNAGLRAGSGNELDIDSSGNLETTGTGTFLNIVESTPTLFKLDQSSPQTVTGTPTFPNISISDYILAQGTYGSGWTEPNLGAGTRCFWYPRKAAFRAGYVASTQWNDANIGAYSFAVGSRTTASGTYSTAMGAGTTASGIYSTAMGGGTTARGNASTAMGGGTTASGDYSTAMGTTTTASGIASTAMGGGTTASGGYSTALGNGTTASGNYSTAMGRLSVSAGEYSFAIGYEATTDAAAQYGISMGYSTSVTGAGAAVALGYNTTASGDYSTAMGNYTTASGDYSTAMGTTTTASGDYSTAMGFASEIYANYSYYSRNNDKGISDGATEYNETKHSIFDTENFKLLDSNETDSDLVTNGDFAADTDWNKGAGWSIDSGTAIRESNATLGVLSQDLATKAGKAYLVIFTVSALTAGGVNARVGSAANPGRNITANGTYRQILIATGVSFRFTPTSADSEFKIDNVSVAEIDAGELYVAGTVTANRGYKVSEDGKNIFTGATGTFTDNDGNTVTVVGGIITALT